MILSNSGLMRKADNDAIAGGVSSVELMDTAAAYVARAAEEYCRGGSACIFCGSGNNGGDGVGAAVHLLRRGCRVRVLLVGSREKMSADSREMERRFLALGGRVEVFDPEEPGLLDKLKSASVIIDALFGIGLNKAVEGHALAAIRLINASGVPVVSADIASGVEADTGRILGEAVRAAKTVSFSLAKPGHFVEPGCTCCGKLDVVDIGIPGELVERSQTGVSALVDGELTLPKRNPISHKGDYGKLLILGGCVGYTGAPSLCARAAVRSGAGLVYLGVPQSIYGITAVKNDEAMPFPLAEDEQGIVSCDAMPAVEEKLSRCDVCVLGPGMGRSDSMVALVQEIALTAPIPMVIDADGLYALSMDMTLLGKAAGPRILTPHEGEFVRMGGVLTGDRLRDAGAFAEKHGCILVLKGHRTIIAFPDGEKFISTHGNPGMAKGGSGDVLAGILGAMLGQLPLKQAVLTGVHLHGLAGDIACKSLGEYAMTAGDMIEMLPYATEMIRSK